jgi:hypothetical protein
MEYVRLYTTYDEDPAVVAAGEAAEVLFLRGIAYAGRAESGGFIPDGQLRRLCPRGARTRAEKLVLVGLWCRDDVHGGYQIRSWDKLQPEHDALAQRRRSDRERKARERQKPQPVSRDRSRDTSRDLSRDVRITEERRGEKNSVTSVSTSRSVPAEPFGDTTPGIAEQILLDHLDACDRKPPEANTAALGKQISALVREGIPPDDVSRGVAAWRSKGLHPSQLPHVVAEVQNRPVGQVALRNGTNGHPVSTTDQRMGAGLALAAKLRVQEGSQ